MDYAQYIVGFVGLYGLGGFVFDAVVPGTARQHLWNPAWPPHAKFHNGQTMMFGIVNAILTVAILVLFQPLTLPLFLVAASVAGSYWVTMLAAQFFPGVAWNDPEFPAVRPLGVSVQALMSGILLGLLAVAVLMAVLLR